MFETHNAIGEHLVSGDFFPGFQGIHDDVFLGSSGSGSGGYYDSAGGVGWITGDSGERY
jgi:hypothetical protein